MMATEFNETYIEFAFFKFQGVAHGHLFLHRYDNEIIVVNATYEGYSLAILPFCDKSSHGRA